MLPCRKFELRLEVDSRLYLRLLCFQKYLEPNHCVRERTNTENPYAVAVIRRSAVVGHVPRKMSAACALFLLYHCWKIWSRASVCVHACTCVRTWVVCITSCLFIVLGFKFGDVLMIRQTAKLKFPPNFPAVRYYF